MLRWIVLGGLLLSLFPICRPFVLLLLAVLLFYEMSPTRILIGNRRQELDAGILIGGLLLAVEDLLLLFSVFPETVRTKVSILMPFGFVILLAASWFAMRHVKQPSIISEHQNPLITFALFFGFVVMLFKPLLIWTYMAEYMLIALGFVLLALYFGRKQDLAWHAKQIRSLFTSKDTILLGISGLLVLHFTIMVVAGVIQLRPDELSLSTLGTIFLIALPGYVWYKLFRIRAKGHQHLPDWPPWFTGVIMATVVAAFVEPVISFVPGLDIDHVGIVGTNTGVSPLFLAVLVFAAFFIAGKLHDHVRRILMLGPILAGLYFLGSYMYYAFSSTFLYVVNVIVRAEAGYITVPVVILMALGVTVFSITGYLSFLYEICRD
ncbi:MAG: hypothetical protein OXR66_09225 [Candidatus Woesearchaeota archaeon]|nr:hypothetical protein [Candidatus Woesearchaeota archaeon]